VFPFSHKRKYDEDVNGGDPGKLKGCLVPILNNLSGKLKGCLVPALNDLLDGKQCNNLPRGFCQADNESRCSHHRGELEQELCEFLTKSSKKTKNAIREEPNLKINDMVAVKQVDNKTWFRGLIQNKIHYRLDARWTILLLDWGRIIEAQNEDVLPLPGRFCHQPCYSQRAI